MNLSPQAPLHAGLQHAFRLFGGKESLIAKHVDEVGQSLASHFGYHLVHYQVDILLLAPRIFATHGMCTEKGAYHPQRSCLLDALHHA